MMASYAKNLRSTPHEVQALMNSCEIKMLLKTVLRETTPFWDSEFRGIDGKAIIRKAHSPCIPSASTDLTLKKNILSNT